MNGLKVFISTDCAKPGTVAVVTACTEFDAKRLLAAELASRGMLKKEFTFQQIDTDRPNAFILRDGDH